MLRESTPILSRRWLIGAMFSGLAPSSGAIAQSDKPKIGFIGAGHIGGALAKIWTEGGYQVMLSARDLGPVKEFVAQLGPNAQAGTSQQAAAWGDVVVVADAPRTDAIDVELHYRAGDFAPFRLSEQVGDLHPIGLRHGSSQWSVTKYALSPLLENRLPT